jgi:hypothetical protein
MTDNSASEAELRRELEKLGAREFEIVALSMNPVRGLAALTYANARGADRPVAYAVSMFDNPDWQPSGETQRRGTNLSVDRDCSHCGGNLMVLVTDDPHELYGETWAPCIVCNKSANTEFWTARGSKFTATPQ